MEPTVVVCLEADRVNTNVTFAASFSSNENVVPTGGCLTCLPARGGSFFSRHFDTDCLNAESEGGTSPWWCAGGLGLAVVVVVAAGVVVNDAVTAWSEVIDTVHPAVPVHAPLQPAKGEPAAGVAVRASAGE